MFCISLAYLSQSALRYRCQVLDELGIGMGDSVPEAPKEINANAKTAGVEQKTGMPQNFRRRE